MQLLIYDETGFEVVVVVRMDRQKINSINCSIQLNQHETVSDAHFKF